MKDKIRLVQKLVENVPGVIYQFQRDPDGGYSFPYAGEGFKALFGLTPEEIQEKSGSIFAKVHADDLEPLIHSIEKSASEMIDWDYEFRAYLAGDELGWIHGYARPEVQSNGSILWHGYLHAITERKKLEEELLKFSRLNHLMGKINTMILHAKNLESLFTEACEIAVMDGKFKMAWIGLIDPQAQVIRKIKSYGDFDNYLDEITPLSLIKDPIGPSARSIIEKRTIVNANTELNDEVAFWRKDALERGFYSSISLPLVVKGVAIGCMNIYSDKVDYFNAPEIKLLEEIAQNVSYAVDVLEIQKALVQSEFSFRTIFENAPIGIAVTDTKTGKLLKANSKFLDIMNSSHANLASLDWMSVPHPDYLKKMVKQIIRANGETGWIEISIVPHFKEGEEVVQHLCMLEDISERVKYETDLKAALKARDEFFSIASHELKTPITSLKLQAQLLKRDLQKDLKSLENNELLNRHSKALDMATRQADRLTFLVDNLLDVTRMEAGQFQIKPVKFNFSHVLYEILERFQSLIDEAENEIHTDIDPEIIGLWDQGRIEQVVVNLISNAIKYAPGGPIQIVLRPEANHAVFKVIDFGPGLPPESVDKIFNQFERVESSVRNISGLGLGLFIAKKIIDAHRGEIFVESELGKGAVFTVKLPLK